MSRSFSCLWIFVLVVFCCIGEIFAAANFRETYIIINGGPQAGDYYYEGLDNGGANVRFDAINQSINLLASPSLTLKGSEAKTGMTGGDYQNTNNWMSLFYRFYDSVDTAPAYSNQTISFIGEDGGYPNYIWRTSNLNINLLSGQDSGLHYMEVYNDGSASWWNGAQQFFDMAQTATYRASFRLFYGATTTATQGSAFTGTGDFNFNGSGQTYTLNQSNTYSGETQIDAGTVAVTGAGTLGSSVIYIGNGGNANNAQLTLDGTTTTFSNNIQVNISSASGQRTLFKDGGTAQTISGGVTLNRDLLIDVSGSGGLSITGVISGSSGYTKNGTGTLTIGGSSANTYSGTTTLNNGVTILNKSAGTNALAGAVIVNSGATLQTNSANQIGSNFVTVNSGGTFNLNNNSQTLALAGSGNVSLGSATITISNGGSDTFSGNISGSGNVVKSGTGAQLLSGANAYSGTTTVSAGTLEVQNANALGSTAGTTAVSSGAVLKLYHETGMSIANEGLSITGTGVSNGGALVNTGGNNTWSGAVTLNGNSRINADTTGANGSLTISGGISGGSNALFIGAQGGSSGRTGGDVSLSGSITGSGASLSDHGNTTTSVFKDGLGALTLSGSSSFTGATLLNQGTILIGNNNAFGNGFLQVHWADAAAKTLASSDSTARTIGNNLNIYNDVTLGAVDRTGSLTFSGPIALGNEAGTRTITTAAGTSHTFAGNVSGLRQIIKEGSGNLTLSGSNDFSGGVQLNNGTILIGSNSALGTGTLQVQFETPGSKTIASTDTSARSITNNVNVYNTLNIGQSSGGTGSLTFSGNVFLGNEVDQNRILNVLGSHTFSGNITGARGLVKQGTGTLTLTGSANTQNGTLFIDNGIVNVNTSSLSNPFIDIGAGSSGESPNNATLRISSASTFASNLTIKNFEGTGGLRTLDFANTSGNATLSGSVTLEKGVTIQVANAGATGVLSGAISGTGGPQITVQGSGTFRPTSTSSTTSATWRVESGATLALNDTRNLGENPEGHYDDKIVLAGGTLRAVQSFTTNHHVGLNAASSSTVSVDSGATLNFQGGLKGSSALAKTGAGTLNLTHSASNYTYNGTWTAQAGTLLVNTNHGGAVTVNAATLGGSGTIGGLVTLNSGGTLTPGNSPGVLATMTLSNGLSLNDSSTVRMDISGTNGSSDVISLSGTLANNGALELNITTAMPGGNFSNAYTIFSGGTKTGSWDSVNLAGVYTGALTKNGDTWTRNTGDGTVWNFYQNTGELTVIPEPSTYALMGIGAAFILWRLRRRRQD